MLSKKVDCTRHVQTYYAEENEEVRRKAPLGFVKVRNRDGRGIHCVGLERVRFGQSQQRHGPPFLFFSSLLFSLSGFTLWVIPYFRAVASRRFPSQGPVSRRDLRCAVLYTRSQLGNSQCVSCSTQIVEPLCSSVPAWLYLWLSLLFCLYFAFRFSLTLALSSYCLL